MTDIQKITAITILTTLTDPLHGTVAIDTASSTMRFELNADLAHCLCRDLERFLTQTPKQKHNGVRYGSGGNASPA